MGLASRLEVALSAETALKGPETQEKRRLVVCLAGASGFSFPVETAGVRLQNGTRRQEFVVPRGGCTRR